VNGGGASLDISLTAVVGTRPSDAGSGVTATVGGYLKGPNGTSTFPGQFININVRNTNSDPIRVNLYNTASYSISAAFTIDQATVQYEGCTSTPGDGGRATIDCGANAIVGVNIAGITRAVIKNIIATTTQSSGNSNGFYNLCQTSIIDRCVATGFRGSGFLGYGVMVACESYANNGSNGANQGGFEFYGHCIRCIAHDNTGSNSSGFVLGFTHAACESCIADTNGSHGFKDISGSETKLKNCDAYNNTGDGINLAGSTANWIENCNLIKNGGYGINLDGNSIACTVINCGFGSGSEANSSGQTNIAGTTNRLITSGLVTYASGVNPWNAPATGDFSITLAAAKNAGIGAFTETAPSYTGTVGYPDIGAAAATNTGGATTVRPVIVRR
jgi:hypothetical protein